MTDNIYPGDTISKTFTFTDEHDEVFDPDTIATLIVNPSGVTVETQDIGDLTRTGEGVYEFIYTLSADAPTGRWHLEVTAAYARLPLPPLNNTEQFAFTVEALTSLRYGDLDTVKNLCAIELTELSFDIQLDTAIKTADNFINMALERCGATVPLTSPEDLIRDASNYLAAGLHKQKDVPDERVHSFWTIGINLLNTYLSTNYPGEALVPVLTEQTTDFTLAYGVGLAT
jgi:hypothetical protein